MAIFHREDALKYQFKAALIAALLIGMGALAGPETFGSATVTQVRTIYDGDTFHADIAGWPAIVGAHIGIRVYGIDTPEMRGKCDQEKQLARMAKQRAVEILRGAKVVELRNMRRDKYFRILADVYADGNNLGDQLIAAGLAVPYYGKTKPNWCAK